MYVKALSIFYALSAFALGIALFVMQPSKLPEVVSLQQSLRQQLTIAAKQTFGDQPMFTDVAAVYDGVSDFYKQSADSTIAMLSDPDADAEIAQVYGQVYHDFALAFSGEPISGHVAGAEIATPQELPPMPADFMQEPPVYNLVPLSTTNAPSIKSAVLGASIDLSVPVNQDNSWVTIADNVTGQLYCLAVYDGTVNKYVGACKNDYH